MFKGVIMKQNTLPNFCWRYGFEAKCSNFQLKYSN